MDDEVEDILTLEAEVEADDEVEQIWVVIGYIDDEDVVGGNDVRDELPNIDERDDEVDIDITDVIALMVTFVDEIDEID